VLSYHTGYIVGSIFNWNFSPQIVIQRIFKIIRKTKQNVNTWALDVGVNYTNASTTRGKLCREV
jgi:hypothetical protein